MKKAIGAFILIFSFFACTRNYEPITFGKDQCTFCKMIIMDSRFGAELITSKGRILKYDAVECLVNHMNTDKPAYKYLWAIGYDSPKKLYPIDSLYFIISASYKSPMGENLASFIDTNKIQVKNRQNILTWKELKKKFSGHYNQIE